MLHRSRLPLRGLTLTISKKGDHLYEAGWKFLNDMFLRIHGLNHMEVNITHILTLTLPSSNGMTIIGAGSYAPHSPELINEFEAGIRGIISTRDPVVTTSCELIAKWDAIALLPKEEIIRALPKASEQNISLLRSHMVDILYAAAHLISADRGDYFLSMIGSIKVGEICERIGLPARYLGAANEDEIRKAFPHDDWTELFKLPRQCFVGDIDERRAEVSRIARQAIISHGCDLAYEPN